MIKKYKKSKSKTERKIKAKKLKPNFATFVMKANLNNLYNNYPKREKNHNSKQLLEPKMIYLK